MTPEIELELYIVRHGESLSNIGSEIPYEFHSDSPLSPNGEKQAKLLGEYFADFPLDYILASGLRRALQTSYEVGIRQPENGARQVEVHKIFTERNTGNDCKSRTIEEIQQEMPIMIHALGTKPEDGTIHHGENDTPEMTFARAQKAVKYLRERFTNGEKVMVVAHAALITDMFFAMLGLSPDQAFDPTFYNSSITKVVFFKEGTGPYADIHLEYQNAVPHLLNKDVEYRD